MNWGEFAAAAPELAGLGQGLLERAGLCFLATLRADGWPRISPCEPFIVDGEMMLGMMWRSKKALDLHRDPRFTLHSAHAERAGTEGDFKLYGRAVEVTDPQQRERYALTLENKIEWRPADPYHLFCMDIEHAAYIRFGEDREALRWSPAEGLVHLRHPAD
jgi:hypothetical protein